MTTAAYPLDLNRIPGSNPQLLVSQPDPPFCQSDALHAAPNGRWLVVQSNCEDGLFARLVDTGRQFSLLTLPRGYFLDWSADGNYFLFRDIDQDKVFLYQAFGGQPQVLNLPAGSYGATFTPDGQGIVYVSGRGLGFGSEMGLYERATNTLTVWQSQPDQIIAYPQFSADGQFLAYILLADNNIPFTVGQLWLADGQGQPLRLLAEEVDGGHGYPPRWSPDGQTIVYVGRENPASVAANHWAGALHSNLYQVSPAGDGLTQLTHFVASLVYDPVWGADGRQLAFTAQDGVWLLNLGQAQPVQISPAGVIARHPTWLALPTP